MFTTYKIKMMADVMDTFTREIHKPGYRPKTKRSLAFGFTGYERWAEKERKDRRRLEGKKR